MDVVSLAAMETGVLPDISSLVACTAMEDVEVWEESLLPFSLLFAFTDDASSSSFWIFSMELLLTEGGLLLVVVFRTNSAVVGWRPAVVDWRPAVVGWRPAVVDWRPAVVGWRPAVVGWRPAVVDWRPLIETVVATLLPIKPMFFSEGYETVDNVAGGGEDVAMETNDTPGVFTGGCGFVVCCGRKDFRTCSSFWLCSLTWARSCSMLCCMLGGGCVAVGVACCWSIGIEGEGSERRGGERGREGGRGGLQ